MLGVPKRGEVWQVDFGVTQKVRPALIISIPYSDTDRALIGVIPHTTGIRGSQFEVSVPARFLAEGTFLVQGVQALPPRYFLRRLGVLPLSKLSASRKSFCAGMAFHPDHAVPAFYRLLGAGSMRLVVKVIRAAALATSTASLVFFFLGADSVERSSTLPLLDSGMLCLAFVLWISFYVLRRKWPDA